MSSNRSTDSASNERPLKVCVIAGGPSSEAAVSWSSARGVQTALESAGCEVATLPLGEQLAEQLNLGRYDVAFPVAHGPMGEDGCLQGLLETVGLPYVGSGVRGSAIAAHKPTAKVFFEAAGLPLARQKVLPRGAWGETLTAELNRELGSRIIVKPASGGSAIGVTRLDVGFSSEALRGALDAVWENDAAALLESWHSGLEVTCGVLEDEQGVRALPPTLVHAEANEWYDFASRYGPGGSRHECPAPLGDERVGKVSAWAVAAHLAVGARDYSRVDFVIGDDPIVLEVNTLPGMTPTSNFPEAAEVAGIPFPELCLRLVRRAHRRPRRLMPAAVPIPQ